MIYIRLKYGGVIVTIELESFKFELRSDGFIDYIFNEKIIQKHIRNYFINNYKYYDARLLRSILFVFNEDLILSRTNINSVFYYSKLNKLRVSYLSIPSIEKYGKHDKFSNVDFAQLLIHEYLHHWSIKHLKSLDINHMGRCWRTIN
jgi:hypothetical protein